MKRITGTLAFFLMLVGAACTNIYTPTPSLPTSTLAPLATFTPRYTATPIPTASPRPTFTHTPSVTPVPPTASNTPTATPTPPIIGRVSTVQEAVNMREGPGLNYTAIVGVLNNTDLIVLAANEEQTWYNVRLEDGTEGWIAANLIFLPDTPTPQPTNTIPGVVVEVSGTPLATALLGGLPVTATPSFTPAGGDQLTGIPATPRRPGTVTATVTVTPTVRGAGIPTVTSGPPLTATATAAGLPTSDSIPTLSGTVLPIRQGYDVLAYCEQFDEVPPPLSYGTTIDVFWGWIADTQAYLQQHITNAIYEVRLDGELLDNWRLYADDIRQIADGRWSIYWYVPIEEPLDRGMHTISFRLTWRNPIFDGQEEFGPGTANEVDIGSCTFEIR